MIGWLNKLKMTVIGGAIAVSLTVLVSALDLYAADSLQFRGHSHGEPVNHDPDARETIREQQVEACNPTFWPASFDRLHVYAIHEDIRIISLTMEGADLPPGGTAIVAGELRVDRSLMFFIRDADLPRSDYAAWAQDMISIDDALQDTTVILNVPVLGFIPVEIIENPTQDELSRTLSPAGSIWDCS